MTTLGPVITTAALATIGFTSPARPQPPRAVESALTGAQGRGADTDAIARGRQIVAQTCAACHGADGRGGAEVNTDLSRSSIVFGDEGGKQLGDFLKIGRPEQRMPPFALWPAEVNDLAAYLHSIATTVGRSGGRATINAVVVGDARAGERYFNTAGCAQCHSATGDLKGIGSRLPVATIQGRIVVPRGDGGYLRSFNSPPNPNQPQRTVTITQPSGERISGTLMWITDFYVTLTDSAGVRRTMARNGDVPKVEVIDPLQWHIDHMKTLTDTAMHDLTAYLVTLK
jgi:cytochrome c oxidase cbb3-type subunit III